MILVLSHGIRQDSNLINSHSTLSQVNDKICLEKGNNGKSLIILIHVCKCIYKSIREIMLQCMRNKPLIILIYICIFSIWASLHNYMQMWQVMVTTEM